MVAQHARHRALANTGCFRNLGKRHRHLRFEFHRMSEPKLYWNGLPICPSATAALPPFFTAPIKKQGFFGSATNLLLAALPKWISKNGSAAKNGLACCGRTDRRPRQQQEEKIMLLALKSGNFGGEDFFAAALAMMH